jgi:hypothetical protein
LFGIGGPPKALGKFEEFPLLALLSLDPVLDEFQEHSVGAKPSRLRLVHNAAPEF